MADKTVEMDFWLHLMLSLQCQAPGLLVVFSFPSSFLSFFLLRPLFFPLLRMASWGTCPFTNNFLGWLRAHLHPMAALTGREQIES